MKKLTTTEYLENQPKNNLRTMLNLGAIIVIALILPGCFAHSPHRHGNPHHQHANTNVQISIEYDYYPSLNVYYDRHRRLYHYHDTHRGWLSVSVLPSHIRVQGQRHQMVHSKGTRPWQQNHRGKRPQSHVEPRHSNRKEKHKNSR